MTARSALGWFTLAALAALAACRAAPRAATGAELQSKMNCAAVTAPLDPLLLVWDPGVRAELDRARRQGVVAVRYEASGCNVSLELVPRCVGPKDKYVYTAASSQLGMRIPDANELYGQLPLGAEATVAKLADGNVLRADARVVGILGFAPGVKVSEYDLVGPECKRATHIVSAIHVGGFGVVAGAPKVVADTDAFAKPIVDPFVREGYAAACERAVADGKDTAGCAVPIRAVLQPIGAGAAAPSAPSAPSAPAETGSAAPVGDVFDQNAVERVVRERQGPLRRKCWEASPATLKRVTMTVQLSVEPPGTVTAATPTVNDVEGGNDLAGALAKCVANDILGWRFPDPESKKVLTLPFHFMRQ